MNEIQYVYDAGGNKKSVIAPIELWEKMLQLRNSRHEPCNPMDYYGISRDIIKDSRGVAKSLRKEWNRV